MPTSATPRKAPAKKAPAKKAAPTKAEAAEAKKTRQRVLAFDALRARAGTTASLLAFPESEPIEIGPEAGFDPPLVASFPADLELKVQLEAAARHGDALTGLNILLGNEGFMRAVRAFKTQSNGEQLLVGLYLHIQDRLFGRGAGDVPGGTPASSPS